MREKLLALSPFSLETTVDLGKSLLFGACLIPSTNIHKLYSATFSPVGPPQMFVPPPYVFSILVRGRNPGGSTKNVAACSSSSLTYFFLSALLALR